MNIQKSNKVPLYLSHQDHVFSIRDISTRCLQRQKTINEIIELFNKSNLNLLNNLITSTSLQSKIILLRHETLLIIDDIITMEYEFKKKYHEKVSKYLPLDDIADLSIIHNLFKTLLSFLTDVDIILQNDQLYRLLPSHIPRTSNPFFLGLTINQLCSMDLPKHDHVNNSQHTTKILEIIRWKRSILAIVRAQIQLESQSNFLHIFHCDEYLNDKTPSHDKQIILNIINIIYQQLDLDQLDFQPQHLFMILMKQSHVTSISFEVKLNITQQFMNLSMKDLSNLDVLCLKYISSLNVFNESNQIVKTLINKISNLKLNEVAIQSMQTIEDLKRKFDQVSIKSPFISRSIDSMTALDNYRTPSRPSTVSSKIIKQYEQPIPTSPSMKQNELLPTSPKKQHEQPISPMKRYELSSASSMKQYEQPIPPIKQHEQPISPMKLYELSSASSMKQYEQSISPIKQHEQPTSPMKRHELLPMSPSTNSESYDSSSLIVHKTPQISISLPQITLVVQEEIQKVLTSSKSFQKNANPNIKTISRPSTQSKQIRDRSPLPRLPLDKSYEEESLSSVRYDLLNIQRELIRRNILQTPSTKRSINMKNTKNKRETHNAKISSNTITTSSDDLLVLTIDVDVSKYFQFLNYHPHPNVCICIHYHSLTNSLTCELCWFREVDETREYQVFASMSISLLSFNFFTELESFSSLLACDMEKKEDLLKEVIQQLHEHVEDLLQSFCKTISSESLTWPFTNEIHHLILKFDRLLYSTVIQDTFGMLAIECIRNIECSGMTISCRVAQVNDPMRNTTDNTSPYLLSMHISDAELCILLINQKGLFQLSQKKWSCLQSVAQWICDTRLTFQRWSLDAYRMLIDRHVFIDANIIRYWNVCCISIHPPGLKVDLELLQELELLNMKVSLKFPSKEDRLHFIEEEKQYILLDYLALDEGNVLKDLKESQYVSKDDVVLVFQQQLNAQEILSFGSCTTINELQVSLNTHATKLLNDNKDILNPFEFLWKILQRLKLNYVCRPEHGEQERTPYSNRVSRIDDSSNWSIEYDRRIIQEVRTISGVMIKLTALVFGGQLLFQTNIISEHQNPQNIQHVTEKLFSIEDLIDIVNKEGWDVGLLEASSRYALARKLMSRLKVIFSYKTHQYHLEHVMFPETMMIQVVYTSYYNTGNEIKQIDNMDEPHEVPLAMIEINENMTLSDTRVILKHEIDGKLMPKKYQFIYKGYPCSSNQEALRRVWECLPKLVLLAQYDLGASNILNDSTTKSLLDDKISKANEMDGSISKSNDRVPIPIMSLGQISHESRLLFLLHCVNDLKVGDMLRIGSIQSRDYLITSIDGKCLEVDPPFDISQEVDNFNVIRGNVPYFSSLPTTLCSYQSLMKSKRRKHREDESITKDQSQGQGNVFAYHSHRNIVSFRQFFRFHFSLSILPIPNYLNLSFDEHSNITSKQSNSSHESYLHFQDLWLWKLIPKEKDLRPSWRKIFDDGLVNYEFKFQTSCEFFRFFKVRISFAYLEILCIDARLMDSRLTWYSQRWIEMKKMSHDFVVTSLHSLISQWDTSPPQISKSISSSKKKTHSTLPIVLALGIPFDKFLLFLQKANIFPDMNRQARIETLKSQFSLRLKEQNEKTYDVKYNKLLGIDAFRLLIFDIAITRFPVGYHHVPIDFNHDFDALCSIPSYPKADPIHVMYAHRRLVNDFLFPMRELHLHLWEVTKLRAMEIEAKKYCAATKMISIFRMFKVIKLYKTIKKKIILIQTIFRMKLCRNRLELRQLELFNDWIIRMRYHAACRIQRKILGFLFRCRYLSMKREILQKQIEFYKTRVVERYSHIRKMKQASLLLRYVTSLNGLSCVVTIKKHEVIVEKQDLSIDISVYLPHLQLESKFHIPEETLRRFYRIELFDPSYVLNVFELYDPTNLKRVLKGRILIRSNPCRVMISKQGLGQRGRQVYTSAFRSKGENFVCRVYNANDEISFVSYHSGSSKNFTCSLSFQKMLDWFNDENEHLLKVNDVKVSIPSSKSETIADKSLTSILFPHINKMNTTKENHLISSSQQSVIVSSPVKQDLIAMYQWCIDHLVVDKRQHRFMVMFNYQFLQTSRKEFVIKIQKHWRRIMTQRHVRDMLEAIYLKVYSVEDEDDSDQSAKGNDVLQQQRRNSFLDSDLSMIYKLSKQKNTSTFRKASLISMQPISSPEFRPKYYYLNRQTGETSWHKSKLIGQFDFHEPYFRWVDYNYLQRRVAKDDVDGIEITDSLLAEFHGEDEYIVHYVNPFTGKYTHLSIHEAAMIIQRIVRRFQFKKLSITSLEKFKKIHLLIQRIDSKFNCDSDKLANIINKALQVHLVSQNEKEATTFYEKAMELSPNNPLVIRVYALFILCTCKPPLTANRERAIFYFTSAKINDMETQKFELAHLFYQYAYMLSPHDINILLLYSMMELFIYNNLYNASMIFYRLFSIDPFNERVMSIWKWLQHQDTNNKTQDHDVNPFQYFIQTMKNLSLESLNYYPLSRTTKSHNYLQILNTAYQEKKVSNESKDIILMKLKYNKLKDMNIIENTQWAGWVLAETSYRNQLDSHEVGIKQKKFWFNLADGSEQEYEPDFQMEWWKRLGHSIKQSNKSSNQSYESKDIETLELYYDPLTSSYFQYHPLTDTFT